MADLTPDDERLRRLFARMRAEDHHAAPAFPTLETDADDVRRWRGSAAPTIAAIAAAAVAVALWLLPGGAPYEDPGLLAEWSPPSNEFLGLDDLGSDLGVDLTAAFEDIGSNGTDLWIDLPTDVLIDQADEMLGQESTR